MTVTFKAQCVRCGTVHSIHARQFAASADWMDAFEIASRLPGNRLVMEEAPCRICGAAVFERVPNADTRPTLH